MKKLIAAALAVAFAVTVGVAWAATEKCTVESVDEENKTVTLKCEEGKLKLKAGDEVKVQKKTPAFEGC